MKKVIRQAIEIFETFRGRRAKRIKIVDYDVPVAVAPVGYVEAIAYRTTYGTKVEDYLHEFKPGCRPLLCASHDGRQLILLGGGYVFDAKHGIVDKNPDGSLDYDPEHGKYAGFLSRRQAS